MRAGWQNLPLQLPGNVLRGIPQATPAPLKTTASKSWFLGGLVLPIAKSLPWELPTEPQSAPIGLAGRCSWVLRMLPEQRSAVLRWSSVGPAKVRQSCRQNLASSGTRCLFRQPQETDGEQIAVRWGAKAARSPAVRRLLAGRSPRACWPWSAPVRNRRRPPKNADFGSNDDERSHPARWSRGPGRPGRWLASVGRLDACHAAESLDAEIGPAERAPRRHLMALSYPADCIAVGDVDQGAT